MKITIQEAHVFNQKERITKMLYNYFLDIASPKTDEHVFKAYDKLLSSHQNVIFLVATKQNVPIGFLFGNIGIGLESGGLYFWLNDIYVVPEERHQGVASNMLQALEDILNKKKIHYIASITHPHNQKSQDLFKKLSFKTESMIWMDKNM